MEYGAREMKIEIGGKEYETLDDEVNVNEFLYQLHKLDMTRENDSAVEFLRIYDIVECVFGEAACKQIVHDCKEPKVLFEDFLLAIAEYAI
jgi:hypothetical protein